MTSDERKAFTAALEQQVKSINSGPAFDPGSEQGKVLDILRAAGKRIRTAFDDFKPSFMGNVGGKPVIQGQGDSGPISMTYGGGHLRVVDTAAGGHPRPLTPVERDTLSRAIQHQLAQGNTAIDPDGLRKFLRDAGLVAPGKPLPTRPEDPIGTTGGG